MARSAMPIKSGCSPGFSEPQFTGHARPGDPQGGCYLTSNAQPDQPDSIRRSFSSARGLGWCPHDANRDRLESHTPLGWKFLVTHDISEDSTHRAQYRRCRKCSTLFFDGDPLSRDSVTGEEAMKARTLNYVVTHSRAEDDQNQANWRQCGKCASVFWAGAGRWRTLSCWRRASRPRLLDLLLSHPSFVEDGTIRGTGDSAENAPGSSGTATSSSKDSARRMVPATRPSASISCCRTMSPKTRNTSSSGAFAASAVASSGTDRIRRPASVRGTEQVTSPQD